MLVSVGPGPAAARGTNISTHAIRLRRICLKLTTIVDWKPRDLKTVGRIHRRADFGGCF
jgi:hypothetical protein